MIAAKDFEDEYNKKAADDNRLFRMEFMVSCCRKCELLLEISYLFLLFLQSLANPSIEKSAAHLEKNRIKNRYDNVLPYDQTRVVLSHPGDDATGGYINANFVSVCFQENSSF